MLGQDFPVSDYYKNHIVEAVTISRTGTWWTAILVIRDPTDQKPFIGLYKWQHTSDGWKARSKFNINSHTDLKKLLSGLSEFEKFMR